MAAQGIHTDTGVAASAPGRGERAEQALASAVLDLIDEEGVTGLTVDKIAARAKVGKPTIYRRWANKEELVAHALGTSEIPPAFDPDGELRETLVAVLTNLGYRLTSTRVGRVWCRLLGSDDRYSEATRLYADRFISPRIEALVALLQREIGAGTLRSDLDPVVTVTMMVSTVVGGILNIRPTGQPTPEPELIVDTFLRGLTP
jgi:AcrR family transcriptional regulator